MRISRNTRRNRQRPRQAGRHGWQRGAGEAGAVAQRFAFARCLEAFHEGAEMRQQLLKERVVAIFQHGFAEQFQTDQKRELLVVGRAVAGGEFQDIVVVAGGEHQRRLAAGIAFGVRQMFHRNSELMLGHGFSSYRIIRTGKEDLSCRLAIGSFPERSDCGSHRQP
jgi:hypothetical protein